MKKIYNIWSVMIAFSIFIMLNAPSLKILYSSEIINIVGVLGVTAFGLLRYIMFEQKRKIPSRLLYIIVYFFLLWTIFFIYALFGPLSDISVKEFVQYLSVIILIISILVFLKIEDINKLVFFQIMWAIILAISYFMGLISLDRGLGQHYLTLGVPLALGFIALSGIVITKNSIKKFIPLGLGMFLLLACLFTLSGRAPVLFSSATVVLFWVMHIIRRKGGFKSIKNILTLGIVSYIGYIVMTNFLTDRLLRRFIELSQSIEEENRYYMYVNAFKLISKNPYGYGLNAYSSLTGSNYPHNIFIEIMISTGIIGLAVFLLILYSLIKVIYHIIYSFKTIHTSLFVFSMFTIYLLLTWNVSFNLVTSYMPFSAMAVTFVGYYYAELKFKNNNLLV